MLKRCALLIIVLCPQSLSALDELSLSGLWSISLGADLGLQKSQDIVGLYGPGLVSLNDSQVFTGADISARRYLMDQVYLGLGFSSMPRSYSFGVGQSGNTDTYDLDGLYPYAMAGLVWYRGLNLYLDLQLEAGALILNQAAFKRTGAAAAKADIEGTAYATAASLGGVWLFIPSVGLQLQGGYRRAYLEHLKLSSGPAGELNLSGSGPFARAGLIFFWGLRDPWGGMATEVEAPKNLPQ